MPNRFRHWVPSCSSSHSTLWKRFVKSSFLSGQREGTVQFHPFPRGEPTVNTRNFVNKMLPSFIYSVIIYITMDSCIFILYFGWWKILLLTLLFKLWFDWLWELFEAGSWLVMPPFFCAFWIPYSLEFFLSYFHCQATGSDIFFLRCLSSIWYLEKKVWALSTKLLLERSWFWNVGRQGQMIGIYTHTYIMPCIYNWL